MEGLILHEQSHPEHRVRSCGNRIPFRVGAFASPPQLRVLLFR